jgi:hypothetical protein
MHHIAISPDLDRITFATFAAEDWVLVACCRVCGRVAEIGGAETVARFGARSNTGLIARRMRCTRVLDGKRCKGSWPELKAVHADPAVAARARRRVLG